MKRAEIFKNKYLLATVVFIVYILFLDDVDIVNIVSQEKKLAKLKNNKQELIQKLDNTKMLLEQMGDDEALERYARENKFFKQDDEDIFVIVYE